jgi:hypothetical protein
MSRLSCRFAPSRWSILFSIVCRTPGAGGPLRPRFLLSHLSLRSKPLCDIFVLCNVNSSVLLWVFRRLNTSHPSFLGRDRSPPARTDYNARSAKDQAPIPGASRVSPQPLLCTRSNWEQSGKRLEGEEKWRLYKTAGKVWPVFSSSTASLHGGKNLHNLCIQLGKL